MQKRKIKVSEICEYCLTVDDRLSVFKKDDFYVSILELAIGVLRTSITKNLKNDKKVLFGINALTLLLGVVNETSRNLLLTKEAKDYFPDFSKSSRVGEIAQGLNYLYFQSQLGYIELNDFKDFAAELCPGISLDKSTPDFVMSTYTNEAIILESKGSWAYKQGKNNLKAAIKNGMRQTHKGFNWIDKNSASTNPIVNTFTSCAWLRDEGITDLYYMDPGYPSQGLLSYRFTLRHFSTWFYLIGLSELAQVLQKGSFLEEDDVRGVKFEEKIIGNTKYLVFSTKNTKNNYLAKCILKNIIGKEDLQFGITEYIWNYLNENKRRNINRKVAYQIKGYSDDNTIIFPDGTLVVVN